MNARDRYLAVFSDNLRKKIDRIPIHVQYIKEEFISKYKEEIMKNYKGKLFNNTYFDIPYILGFDSVFAPFPSSFKVKSLKLRGKNGKLVVIKEDGQSIKKNQLIMKGDSSIL